MTTLLTTKNPDDKRISTYALCMALLALISFINFFLLIFVPLPAQIHDVLNLFDILIALIFLADFFFRLVRVSNKMTKKLSLPLLRMTSTRSKQKWVRSNSYCKNSIIKHHRSDDYWYITIKVGGSIFSTSDGGMRG